MSTSSRLALVRASVRPVLVAALAALLAFTGLTVSVPSAMAETVSPRPATTWVVDAVDDAFGNRWESRDTGTSEVTVQVGDTVEWRFEWGTAAQEHDLTSVDTASG